MQSRQCTSNPETLELVADLQVACKAPVFDPRCGDRLDNIVLIAAAAPVPLHDELIEKFVGDDQGRPVAMRMCGMAREDVLRVHEMEVGDEAALAR